MEGEGAASPAEARAVASPRVRVGPREGQRGAPRSRTRWAGRSSGARGHGIGEGPARPGLLPALPRAPSRPGRLQVGAASRHRPLRGGSLQAKGIFLWILLEASAPGWREAAEGPPGRVPAPPESWRPPSRAGPAAGGQGRCGPDPARRPPNARRAPRPSGREQAVHSPQGLDRTCPVSLPSSGARAEIRARLPAPPPPLSARRRWERQQVTRHLAKNTGSLRSIRVRARARARAPGPCARPPGRPPASQPAANGISSFSLHYYVRWES